MLNEPGVCIEIVNLFISQDRSVLLGIEVRLYIKKRPVNGTEKEHFSKLKMGLMQY